MEITGILEKCVGSKSRFHSLISPLWKRPLSCRFLKWKASPCCDWTRPCFCPLQCSTMRNTIYHKTQFEEFVRKSVSFILNAALSQWNSLIAAKRLIWYKNWYYLSVGLRKFRWPQVYKSIRLVMIMFIIIIWREVAVTKFQKWYCSGIL